MQFPTQRRMSRFDKFLENNIRLEVFHFTISHLVWKFWRFKKFVAPTNCFLHAPLTAGWFSGETEKILILLFLWEKRKVPPLTRWRGDKMFLEIQLSVIKSGCHPDSWYRSEESRIKKPADVWVVGPASYGQLEITQRPRGEFLCWQGWAPASWPVATSLVLCHHQDYLVVFWLLTNPQEINTIYHKTQSDSPSPLTWLID